MATEQTKTSELQPRRKWTDTRLFTWFLAAVLVLWLFAGMIMARFASGLLRATGFTLLVLLVGTYIYVAYGRKTKDGL